MKLSRLLFILTAVAIGTAFHQTQAGVDPNKNVFVNENAADEKPKRPKVPWLGLSARSVQPLESNQLGLPEGFGLVVEYVFHDSPAAKAGIREHDILRKFNDQLLVNPAQLKTLVCSKNKGDVVKLTFLRASEEREVEVELGEHEVPAVAFRLIRPEDGGGMIPVPADPSEELPVANLKELFSNKPRSLRGGVHARNFDFDRSAASLTDDSGTYTLSKDGKSATFSASKDGKEFFSGPVSSEEDRAKLPDDIRKKLDSLEAMVGRAKQLSDSNVPEEVTPDESSK